MNPWERPNDHGENPGDICCQRAVGGVCYEHNPANYPEKKRKHGKHPYTKMSLEYIRAQGKIPGIVERLIPSKPFMKRSDLWNLFDIVYLDPAANEIGFVQTTSWQQRSAHKKKMLDAGNMDVLSALVALGNARVELYGWRKEGSRWQVTVERLEKAAQLIMVAPRTAVSQERLTFVLYDAPSMEQVRKQARLNRNDAR